jgi:hypothetical protein
MYLTALHVVPASGDGEGINAFLHVHHDGSFPTGELNAALVAKVAETCPGILTEESVEVHPGGNEVLSYLDVVARDGIDAAQIRSAIDAFRSELPAESLPLVRIYDGAVGIVLHANIGLWPAMEDEYLVLSNPIRRLLVRPARIAPPVQ